MTKTRAVSLCVLAVLLGAANAIGGPVAVRVATFNVEDLRTDDLKNPNQPRVKTIVETIQRIHPNILFVNEIAYDEPGSPGYATGDERGLNGQRLADLASKPGVPAVKPIRYRAFMARSNTGIHSGYDLNHDGVVVDQPPTVPGAKPDGSPGEQTKEGRDYGNDCWGFGTFPGQYGMALLVDDRLEILTDQVRTFRLLPWDYMPNALMPTVPPEDGAGPDAPATAWYEGEVGAKFRLSSKSHWDVPVKLPNGSVLHVLCSHPTPPAFDGPEGRNKRRNHDEIRFWADYISGAAYIVDDTWHAGGLERDANFVIVGDMNADPDEGSGIHDPIGLVLGTRGVGADPHPTSEIEIEGLDPDDTSRFKLRVDYVLPSAGLGVRRTGVWREPPSGGKPAPSDHFPVWAEVVVPDAGVSADAARRLDSPPGRNP